MIGRTPPREQDRQIRAIDASVRIKISEKVGSGLGTRSFRVDLLGAAAALS
jgi:hypothetical protein